jgi:hypothetical protein
LFPYAARQKTLYFNGTAGKFAGLKVVLPKLVNQPTGHVACAHNVAESRVSSAPIDEVRIAQLVNPPQPLERAGIEECYRHRIEAYIPVDLVAMNHDIQMPPVNQLYARLLSKETHQK